MKRLLSLILCTVLLFSFAGCAMASSGDTEVTVSEDVSGSAAPAEEEAVTVKNGWHFNAKGFLVGDNPGDEYLLEDEKNGIWQFATSDLAVTITRTQETVKVKAGKRTRELYIADIQASESSPLFTITTPPTKTRPAGYKKSKPIDLVKANPVVLAVSDDYYGHRMQGRDKGTAKWPDGIIIRNGELISSKTRTNGKVEFPPLDTLAVYPDGSMKADPLGEKSADDFCAEGAVQVFSFGPWLIRNGEINVKGVDSSKSYMYNTAQHSDSRIAIGMIEPYHYLVILAKGRPDNKFIGVNFDVLAHKMLELGCTEALNLDGGGTASMIFNGKVIAQGDKTVRPLGSMIAFGKK